MVAGGQRVNEDESGRLDVELPNVGRGSDKVQSANLAADGGYVLVVLLGSHYCPQSRELVRMLTETDEAFRRRGTTVVPVLPDIRERARLWDRQYELPFPMLADPAADGDEYDAFGAFEPLQRSVPELPAFALCRARDGALQVVATETEATLDVPVVESLLAFVERHRASGVTAAPGNPPVDS